MRFTAIHLIVAMSVAFAVPPDSRAQWVRTNGPCGGSGMVFSLTVDSVNVFAASMGEIYRSTDKGNSWSLMYSTRSTAVLITSLAMNGQCVYAGINSSGPSLLRSPDRGVTWALDTVDVSAPYDLFAVAAPGTAILACSQFGSGAAGMFRSVDNGTHWTRVHPSGVASYAVQGETVFAAVSNQSGDPRGIYFSGDTGATWIVTSLVNIPVYCVAVIGRTVFAGTDSAVYRSTNNGATWEVALATMNHVNAVTISPGDSIVFAGTDSGVCRSTDLGRTWVAANAGLRSIPVYSLGVFPSGNSGSTYVFAGTGGGIFRSTDQGTTWKVSGLPNHQFLPSMSLASDGTRLFAGAGFVKDYPAQTFHQVGVPVRPDPETVIFVSTDDGGTWTEVDAGLSEMHGQLTSLLSNGPVTYAATYSSFAGTQPAGVFRTTNGGVSWANSSSGMNNSDVFALASSGAEVVAGVGFGNFSKGVGGVEISTNAGVNWSAADSGLPGSTISALAGSGTKWFAGTMLNVGTIFNPIYKTAVYCSSDNGTSWAVIDSDAGIPARPLGVSSMAVDGSTLIVGTYGVKTNYDLNQTWSLAGGVFRLTYDGQQWHRSDSALTGNYVTSLVSTGHNVFAGTFAGGVFASSDGGVSWRSISVGLTDVSVGSLVIKGAKLFAATSSGVWERPLSEITSVQGARGAIPQTFSLEQNYPNPFNPTTTIRYGLVSRSHVNLTVFNTLGQQVAVLVNEIQEEGYHDVQFNGSRLATGVYFYRMMAGGLVSTRKLLLTK